MPKLSRRMRAAAMRHLLLLSLFLLVSSYSPNRAPPLRVVSSDSKQAVVTILSGITGAAIALLPLTSPAGARTNKGSAVPNKLARGFKGPQSVYSPSSPFYYPSILPQSMLLNTLPIKYDLIGQLQNLLESFLNLANINNDPLIEKQIRNKESLLWRNLRINAQRAAGMFLYNMADLDPLSAADASSSSQIDPAVLAVRKQYASSYTKSMQSNVLQLVNSSINSLVPDSLYHMRMALNDLCNVAYMLLPVDYDGYVMLNNTQPVLEASSSQQLAAIPSLLGRATVEMVVQRAGGKFKKSPIVAKDFPDNTARVQLLLDGINAPLAAGSFIDLIKKGFYSKGKVREDKFDYINSVASRVILGGAESSYSETLSQSSRRVPLEILREGGGEGRFVATGAARNSAVFTKSHPVKSFATLGAVGMNHEVGDPNGGTADFFFVTPDRSLSVQERSALPAIRRLDARYSLFAYCIDGIDILEQLRAGDRIIGLKLVDGCYSIETSNDVEYSGQVMNSKINL